MIIVYPDSYYYTYFRADVVEPLADSYEEYYVEIDEEFVDEETKQ